MNHESNTQVRRGHIKARASHKHLYNNTYCSRAVSRNFHYELLRIITSFIGMEAIAEGCNWVLIPHGDNTSNKYICCEGLYQSLKYDHGITEKYRNIFNKYTCVNGDTYYVVNLSYFLSISTAMHTNNEFIRNCDESAQSAMLLKRGALLTANESHAINNKRIKQCEKLASYINNQFLSGNINIPVVLNNLNLGGLTQVTSSVDGTRHNFRSFPISIEDMSLVSNCLLRINSNIRIQYCEAISNLKTNNGTLYYLYISRSIIY